MKKSYFYFIDVNAKAYDGCVSSKDQIDNGFMLLANAHALVASILIGRTSIGIVLN